MIAEHVQSAADEDRDNLQRSSAILLTRLPADHHALLASFHQIVWPCDKNASEGVRAANAQQAAECALVMLRECGEYDVGKGQEVRGRHSLLNPFGPTNDDPGAGRRMFECRLVC